MTRRNEFDAHRYLRRTRHKHEPRRRSDDMDYRPLWYVLVGVATALAVWSTF